MLLAGSVFLATAEVLNERDESEDRERGGSRIARVAAQGRKAQGRNPMTQPATGISKVKRAEEARDGALAYAESIVETVREPLVVLDEQLRVMSANRSFYEPSPKVKIQCITSLAKAGKDVAYFAS